MREPDAGVSAVTYTHTLTVKDYTALRGAVGWRSIPPHQAEASLKGSAFVVAATQAGKTVGMGRIVSDGGCVAYIGDVIVLPAYQRQGIGQTILDKLMEHLRMGLAPGDKCFVCLMANQGKERFYEKNGFSPRPGSQEGAGMSLWLEP